MFSVLEHHICFSKHNSKFKEFVTFIIADKSGRHISPSWFDIYFWCRETTQHHYFYNTKFPKKQNWLQHTLACNLIKLLFKFSLKHFVLYHRKWKASEAIQMMHVKRSKKLIEKHVLQIVYYAFNRYYQTALPSKSNLLCNPRIEKMLCVSAFILVQIESVEL